MEKYFIHDGLKQIGPFSLTELIEKGITSCTPVYSTAIGHYVIASEIPLLNNAFGTGSLSNNSSLKKTKKRKTSLIKSQGWIVAALVTLIASYVIYRYEVEVTGNSQMGISTSTVAPVSVEKEELRSRSALEQKEAGNPGQYLSVHSKMHKNFLGRKIIKGNIANLASATGYKDLQIEVVFLSAGKEELQTQKFIVNGLIKPNNDISFRNVFKAPPETDGFMLKVLSATPMF